MVLRSVRERILQTLLYEVGGLAVVLPLYAIATGHSAAESLAMLIAVSIACLLWSGIHNTLFDVVEQTACGPQSMRLVHAFSHELTSIIVTTPVIMIVGGIGFIDALLIDIGLTIAYTAYAYFFHMTFDFFRPMTQSSAGAVPPMGFVQHAYLVEQPVHFVPHVSQSRTRSIGVHIMLDGYGAPRDLLGNEAYLRHVLQKIPAALTRHPSPLQKGTETISMSAAGDAAGFASQEHDRFSFQTIPARGFVSADIFLSHGDVDPQHAVLLLKRAFQVAEADVYVQERGLRHAQLRLAS
jgi:uncharacterized membrane protein/S-adenosylmethionine/arginine decarboxylase-like enzyme